MSNHCHLVLLVDQSRALSLDDREVARRWTKLFGGLPLVRSFAAGETLSEAQLAAVMLKVDVYRRRLFDISWFMRCLNEPIARMANAEDNATGRLVSRPREFHPQPLPEPDVTLSRHPAPIIGPWVSPPSASRQRVPAEQ